MLELAVLPKLRPVARRAWKNAPSGLERRLNGLSGSDGPGDPMTVFISYARKDRGSWTSSRRDIERAKHQVWLDHDLTGGQDWWDTILAQIRDCRLFIFVLTPDSIRSKACLAELRYASDLGRPIVPVMVRDVAVQLAPQAIARAHIVDYRQRSAEGAVDLMNAVVSAPDPVPLPAELPEPPTLPASYASSLRDQIGADSLTLREQGAVLMELKAHLGDAEERGVALDLLRDLRRRSDIAEVVAKDLDNLLAEQVAAPDGAPRETAEEGVADDVVEQIAPTDIEATEDSGSNHSADGIKPSRHRQRTAVTLVVVGVVATVAVAAIVVLTSRGGNDDSDGGDDSGGVDVESAEVNFRTTIDEATFDETGLASFDECPLGDMSDLVRTANGWRAVVRRNVGGRHLLRGTE